MAKSKQVKKEVRAVRTVLVNRCPACRSEPVIGDDNFVYCSNNDCGMYGPHSSESQEVSVRMWNRLKYEAAK